MYVTLAEVRAEGIADPPYSDARVQDKLDWAQLMIEQATGMFFEKRTAQTYLLDGSGTPILELPAPGLAITSVKIDGDLVDSTRYVNRNRWEADDYWYPRLEVRDQPTRLQRALGQARSSSVWPVGQQNIEVKGDFGFVITAPSASASGVASTPPGIKRATIRLAAKVLRELRVDPAGLTGGMQSETLGNYSYTLGQQVLTGATGDPEIDLAIGQYKRLMMGTG
jgi:hypothetical protein